MAPEPTPELEETDPEETLPERVQRVEQRLQALDAELARATETDRDRLSAERAELEATLADLGAQGY